MIKNLKSRREEEWDLREITQNSGFLRIARAINSATVYAGKIHTKNGTVELDWQRQYGLAQRLSSQAGAKKDFVIELAAFLASYENENLRIVEKLQQAGKFPRIWTTKDDLDAVIQLIDKFGSTLVANLLIVYGYAKWSKAKDDEQPEQAVTIEEEVTTEEDATGESDDE